MNEQQIVAYDRNHFIIDMPDEAPPLGFDGNAPDFDWRSVMPSNYWNLDDVEAKRMQLGGWPVYTPRQVRIQPVEDPEEKKPTHEPKIVLYFQESAPALVCNRTRCNQLSHLAGTRDPRQWVRRLPKLELYAGVDRQFSMSQQILVRAAPGTERPPTSKPVSDPDLDQLNEELFG